MGGIDRSSNNLYAIMFLSACFQAEIVQNHPSVSWVVTWRCTQPSLSGSLKHLCWKSRTRRLWSMSLRWCQKVTWSLEVRVSWECLMMKERIISCSSLSLVFLRIRNLG